MFVCLFFFLIRLLKHSCRLFRASLVAHLVKNPPARQETWVQSLGWEDPLEKRTTTHSSILAWRIPWTGYSPCGRKESDTTEWLSLHSGFSRRDQNWFHFLTKLLFLKHGIGKTFEEFKCEVIIYWVLNDPF